jgi:TonB family protein
VQEHGNAALHEELAALQTGAPAAVAPAQLKAAPAVVAGQPANLEVSDEELVRLRDEAVALERQLQAAAAQRRAAPVAKNNAVSIKELDHPPKSLSRKAPLYPSELREAGIEGSVVVSMVIDTNGRVIEARIEKSTHQGFEFAALRAVQEWQFEPGRKGGRQVNTRVSQVLAFKSGNDTAPVASDWF